MRLDLLSTSEMSGLSKTLLDTQSQPHKICKKYSLLVEIFGPMQATHDDISGVSATAGELSGQIGQLTEQISQGDRRADDIYAASAQIAKAAIELLAPGAERDSLEVAVEAAFPGTIRQVVAAPLAAASGEADKLRKRLTPAVRAELAKIVVYGVTLEQSLDQWITLSDEVGALDTQRSQLMGAADPTRISRGELRARRNQWIKVMRSFLGLIELSGMSEDERKIVLADMEQVVERAVARQAK